MCKYLYSGDTLLVPLLIYILDYTFISKKKSRSLFLIAGIPLCLPHFSEYTHTTKIKVKVRERDNHRFCVVWQYGYIYRPFVKSLWKSSELRRKLKITRIVPSPEK